MPLQVSTKMLVSPLWANATQLCREAELLLASNANARAATLAVIAIEECSKLLDVVWAEYLSGLGEDVDPSLYDISKISRSRWVSHLTKLSTAHIELDFGGHGEPAAGALTDQETLTDQTIGPAMRQWADSLVERAKSLNHLKKTGLYVDFHDGEVICPSNISADQANQAVGTALQLLEAVRSRLQEILRMEV
jgi:AbiV family abortive infection protein